MDRSQSNLGANWLGRFISVFSIHYFLWFAALTSIYGYINVYAQYYANTSAYEYGVLNSILPFVTILTKLFFCSLADRHRAHRSFFICFLTLALFGYGSFFVLPFLVQRDTNKDSGINMPVWIAICIMTSMATISMSVVACLSDAFAMNTSKKNHISFGLIRVWGTLGWGLSSITIAFSNQSEKLPYLTPGLLQLIFLITIDLVIIALWPNLDDFKLDTSASEQEISHPSATEVPTRYGTSEVHSQTSWVDEDTKVGKTSDLKLQWLLFVEVIKERPSILRYMALFVVSGALISLQWSYFFQYITQIFKDHSFVTGISMFGQSMLGELPFFILSKYFIKYFGRSNTLSISIVTIGIRYILYYHLKNYSYYFVLLTEPLAGPNFGLFYVVMTDVGLDYSDCEGAIRKIIDRGLVRNEPRNVEKLRQALRATMQSLMSACYEGLGVGIGSIIGGYIIVRYGFDVLWLWSANIAIVLGVINWVTPS